jgi:hypothetical protein
MMDTFTASNSWQRMMRDQILKPYFYDQRFPGRYRFVDDGKNDMQLRGIDTIVQTGGVEVTIDEKIVHWPRDREFAYDAFALETWSCTVLGRERRGWMYTGEATHLMYCFACPQSEVALDCYLMNFQKMKGWFAAEDVERWARTVTTEINETECRVVPISDVLEAGIPTRRYRFGIDWPEEHFCEVCCEEAYFGYDRFASRGQMGRWYCSAHKPR